MLLTNLLQQKHVERATGKPAALTMVRYTHPVPQYNSLHVLPHWGLPPTCPQEKIRFVYALVPDIFARANRWCHGLDCVYSMYTSV